MMIKKKIYVSAENQANNSLSSFKTYFSNSFLFSYRNKKGEREGKKPQPSLMRCAMARYLLLFHIVLCCNHMQMHAWQDFFLTLNEVIIAVAHWMTTIFPLFVRWDEVVGRNVLTRMNAVYIIYNHRHYKKKERCDVKMKLKKESPKCSILRLTFGRVRNEYK